MNNVDLFKIHLEEKNLKPRSWVNDKYTYFQFSDKLKGGPLVSVEVVFTENHLVTIYVLDFISLSEVMNKDNLYKLLHDISKKYAYLKFYIHNDNAIEVTSSIPVKDNFNAQLVMDIVNQTLNTAEFEYSNIMKFLWS